MEKNKKDFIVSINLNCDIVTDCRAYIGIEAFNKIKAQLTEKVILKALSSIELDGNYKNKTKFNDITNLQINIDYFESD